MIYRKIGKRFIDITLSVLGIIILAPVILLVIVLLAFSNNGKPFFLQRRPGMNGNIFKVIKFKTMNDRRNPDGVLLTDGHRITKVGRFIRKTSLDETPQLFNVLFGDMSLVGPRPLLEEYLSLYSERQKRRHEVRPGITGWAQVNGRNAISWKQKFEYDVWYVENLSFSLDVKILMMTVLKVFKSEDINAPGQATVENFKGNV